MLTGVTVVDFSRHLPGPICTMRLADLGAEVIEVEAFREDEHASAVFPSPSAARETGAFSLRSHRNHKSISLNLRTDEGKALAFALARQADVVVESYRPGVMRHLGLDYDRLWAAHPAVIYCSVTGYGQSGEMHQLGGHDLNVQAVSGFLSLLRDASGKPVLADIPLSDYALGLYASEQICAALVQRARTGRGAYLDVAAADLLAAWVGLQAIFTACQATASTNQSKKGLLAHQVFEAADGQYVALAAVEERYWLSFCRAVGRADWEAYHRGTIAEHPELWEELKALFLSRTQAEWNELGSEVDCCLTAVEEMENWSNIRYVSEREIAYTLPFLDKREPTGAAKSPSPGASDRKAPPWHADCTAELLRRKLNITDEGLRKLKRQGVIPESSV